MGGVDVLRSVPRLLIYLVCASLFAPSTLLLVLVLGLTTWTSLARLVRAQILTLRKSDLAAASRAAGCTPWRTLLRHLLPQIGPVLVVATSLRFADTILLESALSLLGLGSPPPAVWIAAWPGLSLSAVVIALRSAASGLSRQSDPPSLA
ncbi:MAG: hypothetical protein DMH00_10170 [Acidobacteria bacterium]|nr:MAG: hypothetical protein DMH00_10170 [Acidobacteriota bacterium]